MVTLKHSCENWVLNSETKWNFQATQMRFSRPLLGQTEMKKGAREKYRYSWDIKNPPEFSWTERIQPYTENWFIWNCLTPFSLVNAELTMKIQTQVVLDVEPQTLCRLNIIVYRAEA